MKNNIKLQFFSLYGVAGGRLALILAAAICTVSAASGQATSRSLVVKGIAEVEARSLENGREVVKLLPADRVAPGDQVIYTLEIRNSGAAPVARPVVTYPMPAHMRYVADSASGPGAEVRYSVDGGRSFERAYNLRVVGPDGNLRGVMDSDFTHIQWILRTKLMPGSVAFAHFRAVVR